MMVVCGYCPLWLFSYKQQSLAYSNLYVTCFGVMLSIGSSFLFTSTQVTWVRICQRLLLIAQPQRTASIED